MYGGEGGGGVSYKSCVYNSASTIWPAQAYMAGPDPQGSDTERGVCVNRGWRVGWTVELKLNRKKNWIPTGGVRPPNPPPPPPLDPPLTLTVAGRAQTLTDTPTVHGRAKTLTDTPLIYPPPAPPPATKKL